MQIGYLSNIRPKYLSKKISFRGGSPSDSSSQQKEIISDSSRWDAAFNPKTGQVTVTDENDKVLYNNTPFPKFADAPELSDNECILAKIQRLTDPKTGELYDSERERLVSLLKKGTPNVMSQLICEFIEEHAKKAGFSNYQDYIEANPNNFKDVEPESPEAVLRKIIGNPGFFERYKKSGHDAGKIRLNPENIMNLLEDYPEILKAFALIT